MAKWLIQGASFTIECSNIRSAKKQAEDKSKELNEPVSVIEAETGNCVCTFGEAQKKKFSVCIHYLGKVFAMPEMSFDSAEEADSWVKANFPKDFLA